MKTGKLIRAFLPPTRWRLPVIIIAGAFTGLFFFLFRISEASSYLSDDPQVCIHCHIMYPQYASWSHNGHRTVTNCNDCHVPHNNVVNKYWFKANDGLRHATIFSLRNEPEVIYIRDAGRRVVHDNCLRCHENLFTDGPGKPLNAMRYQQNRECLDCHRYSPHDRVNGISTAPDALNPNSYKYLTLPK
jgi:cytochrome c nitrite reductase small subunit